MLGKGQGLEFYGRPLTTNAVISDPVNGQPGGASIEGKVVQAKTIAILSCDFGETFANVQSRNRTNIIFAYPGKDGETANLDTVNLQAQRMTRVFANGGSAQQAAQAAQNVFNQNPFNVELDGERITIGTLGRPPR